MDSRQYCDRTHGWWVFDCLNVCCSGDALITLDWCDLLKNCINFATIFLISLSLYFLYRLSFMCIWHFGDLFSQIVWLKNGIGRCAWSVHFLFLLLLLLGVSVVSVVVVVVVVGVFFCYRIYWPLYTLLFVCNAVNVVQNVHDMNCSIFSSLFQFQLSDITELNVRNVHWLRTTKSDLAEEHFC